MPLLLAAVLLGPTAVTAQRAGGARVGLSNQTGVAPDSVRLQRQDLGRTYWKEVGIATAIPLTVAANLMIDERDEGFVVHVLRRVLGTALAGAIGFLPGALIGAQFSKD
jgi:hypothetical protein